MLTEGRRVRLYTTVNNRVAAQRGEVWPRIHVSSDRPRATAATATTAATTATTTAAATAATATTTLRRRRQAQGRGWCWAAWRRHECLSMAEVAGGPYQTNTLHGFPPVEFICRTATSHGVDQGVPEDHPWP